MQRVYTLTVSFPTASGRYGWSQKTPPREEQVEVTIDIEGIANAYGGQAVRNHGGRASAAGGLIKVRHLRPAKERKKKSV